MAGVEVAERDNRVVGWLRGAGQFLTAVRAELGKVTWPTRKELITYTRAITIAAVLLGLLIGWMDLLLQWILVDGVAQLAR